MTTTNITDPNLPMPDKIRTQRIIIAALMQDQEQFEAVIRDLAEDPAAADGTSTVANVLSLLGNAAAGGLTFAYEGDRGRSITTAQAELIELENGWIQ